MTPLALPLRSIPAATIVMRDARSASSRAVALREYQIGRTPVTGAQYAALLPDAAPGASPAEAPVHPVTWFQAIRWCNAASEAWGIAPAYTIHERDVVWDVGSGGFRLPTEAEWEWACRAETSGPTYGPLSEVAWTAADEVDGPQVVARKRPNAFGLFDTLGNVWEWCWDHADTARYGEYRSLRGGGWADREWSCRASVRRGSAPDAVLEDVGFRIARGAVGEPGSEAGQGWSAAGDRRRAEISGLLPMGWTPLRPRHDS